MHQANNTYKTFNVDPSYQGVNRLFVMAFDARDNRAARNNPQRCYLPKIDISDYNTIIDGRNFYDNDISSDIEK